MNYALRRATLLFDRLRALRRYHLHQAQAKSQLDADSLAAPSETPLRHTLTPDEQSCDQMAMEQASSAVEIIPPRRTTRDRLAIELGVAALASDGACPIALEIAGAANERMFIARASGATTLNRLVSQIRARYPQCEIHPLPPARDPLRWRPGEEVSAFELAPGAPAHAPLRAFEASWRSGQTAQEGTDPLLGLLAAFDALPPESRAVAQLALAPAADAWSEPYWRMAVEHPLERERVATRAEQLGQQRDAGGVGAIMALLLLILLLALLQSAMTALPSWARVDALALAHGRLTPLTASQLYWLLSRACPACLGAALITLAAVALRSALRRMRPQAPVYDQRLVREKTSAIAYHARLRVFVLTSRSLNAEPMMGGARSRRASLIRRADRAEEIAALEAMELERTRILEEGIGYVRQTIARWVRGDLKARVPIMPVPALRNMCDDLNGFIIAFSYLSNADYHLRRLQGEVSALTVALRQWMAGGTPQWPLPSGTALDDVLEILAELRRRASAGAPPRAAPPQNAP
jgi:hypothetical protein